MLNFGTIGTGWITDEFIAGAKDSGLWELAAVYSRDLERARAYAQKHGAKLAFATVEELASCPQVDAVYVASPNALHHAHCKTLLEHGKHVICEKPLCAQAAKVRELYALAEKKGLVFLEAIMFLHQPQLKKLESALGEIGPVSMAKLDFCQRSSKLDRYLSGELPNIFNPRLETGAFMDLGVYCVYPALYLWGKPSGFRISCRRMESGADGSGVITLEYPGKLAVLTYSKLSQAGANSDFQGPEGTVAVESISKLGGISLWRKDGSQEEIYGQDEKYKLMGNEAKDFYRYITEPEASREEYTRCAQLAVDVAEFMEDVRREAGIRFQSDKTLGAPVSPAGSVDA
ncbi:Gfo/Idh/MocA family protein [Acutalibacter sp. 1XD8-33]|uniref:Gfo/Idh/MocA family protein n=1 Tax=Acutalibacter sp. 1XD8-33 TaxID=2320081 RepID=UPI001314F2B3|nr:Gfo/Idh/MocA family oxidoreductase [Acutalibacter sp. 1XD8-33]